MTAISHYFVMDWASVWKDIAAVCCSPVRSPRGCRKTSGKRSSSSTPAAGEVLGPIVDPLLLSFLLSALSVTSTGGGAMEWRHQLCGVIAFIYAD